MKLEKTLYTRIRNLIIAARQTVSRGVDMVQVHTNFEIGRHIVEHEQRGKGRAAYGKEVIKVLAERLVDEFGRGFSERNLASMRAFYLHYHGRRPILQSVTAKLESLSTSVVQTRSRPFTLSWTHYVFLLGIKNTDERNFYEIESPCT